eukprot:2572519-Pyramimonas_sp.AAC.1
MKKFWQRVRLLRSLSLGLATTTRLFHSYCLSVLQYRIQLARVTPSVRRQHREALQILTAGPRHALSYSMLTQLRDLGIPLEFVDLGLFDKATKLRVVMRCKALDDALSELEGLASGLTDDEFIPART